MLTPMVYALRERERILDFFDMVCGQRLTYNYMRIGGVSQDIPAQFLPALEKLVKKLKRFIDEFDVLLKQNEILLARSKGVGILSKEQAINCGISGPVARASGVNWDLRKNDPYSIYERFDFSIPLGETGDCYDRYRVRIEETRQSLRIIEQAMQQIPAGKIIADVPHLIRPPAGDVYAHIESPKGELGFYLVSDNSIAPYRWHVRPPSLINLAALRDMVRGWKVADLIAIFGSIDITMGEVDR
jgi:NADH-quinone oxidoreductase subunit D